jgi:hypothetical protein
MSKKATFSAAVLLAMGSTVTATANQAPAGNGILDIPLPGTIEYESASKLVNESLIIAMKKAPKKWQRCGLRNGRIISVPPEGRCPPTKKKKARK